MKDVRFLVAGIPLALGGIIATTQLPAHADQTGNFPSSLFYTNLNGDTQASIQNRCDCTGSDTDPGDGRPNWKQISYLADNPTYSWNVKWVLVTYRKNAAGTWVGDNWPGTDNPPEGKARVGTPLYAGGPSCVWNAIGYTG